MPPDSRAVAVPAAPVARAQFQERFLQRVLDPVDRLVEAIYSVLIVMTFTLGVSVFAAGLPPDLQIEWVRSLFWAAFGCAVAWGLIDGVVYILTSLFERGEHLRRVRAVQNARSEAEGLATVETEMAEELSFMDAAARAVMVRTIYEEMREAKPPQVRFQRADAGGAVGTFLVAVMAALPVALPLLLVRTNAQAGVRLSNLVACAMLFLLGYRWARYAGSNPWTTGLLLLLVGILAVAIAIPMGG